MLQWEHSAILSTFIKLPFVIELFVLSTFEWPQKTGFTVHQSLISRKVVSLNHWSNRINISSITRPDTIFNNQKKTDCMTFISLIVKLIKYVLVMTCSESCHLKVHYIGMVRKIKLFKLT